VRLLVVGGAAPLPVAVGDNRWVTLVFAIVATVTLVWTGVAFARRKWRDGKFK